MPEEENQVVIRSDQEPPSIIWIIWTDYFAFFAALLPVCLWVVILTIWKTPFFVKIGAVATLIDVGLLTWRLWKFHTVFREGKSTLGRIASAYLARDRGRVEYTYSYQGKFYRSGVSIHRNGRTKALKEGEGVILVVDRRNPGRAFIRSLYLDQ
jgi:hypothetical protein